MLFSHKDALSSVSRLVRVLALLDLADQQLKGLGDILVVARAGLGESAIELLGQLPALLGCDLALLGPEIALVADDAYRDPVGAL